jgi:hypothetical protein
MLTVVLLLDVNAVVHPGELFSELPRSEYITEIVFEVVKLALNFQFLR